MAEEECSCSFCHQRLYQHCLSLTPRERAKLECSVEKEARFRRRCKTFSCVSVLLTALMWCFIHRALPLPQTLAADVGSTPGSMQPPPQPLRPEPSAGFRRRGRGGQALSAQGEDGTLGHALGHGGRPRHPPTCCVEAVQAGHVGALDYLCKEWGCQ